MSLERSAVAILETPGAFILEGPASGAEYNGIRLFGGGINPGEEPKDALIRELDEELLFRPGPNDVLHVWAGPYKSQTRTGILKWREFNVFHVMLESAAQLSLQVPDTATILEIQKEALGQHRERLTEIALYGLGQIIAHSYTSYRPAVA